MNIPTELKTALKSGNVIPFVGAGVSMAVKRVGSGENLFPSWKDLLKRAAGALRADNEDSANMIEILLRRGDYLGAADEAKRALGNRQWAEFLRTNFKVKSDDVCPDSLKLARSVWQLGSHLVITTNYDNVLRWAHEKSEDVAQWNTIARAEQARSIQERLDSPTTWHLHGHIDDIDNLVLTKESYCRLYEASSSGTSERDAAREVLKYHLAARSFLFIGYSLDDYPFVEQLQSLQKLFGGNSAPHFVLLRDGELDRFRSKELGVAAVTYENHGAPLLELIAKLESIAGEGKYSPTESGVSNTEGANNTTTPPTAVADFSPQKPAWNMPYSKKGEYVVGRQEVLDRVRDQLLEGKRTSIGQTAAFQGLGGLGKTQMAVEYAWEYRDSYPAGVIWLFADQDMEPQLSAMALKSKWASPQSDSKSVYDIALHRLKTFDQGLIVFDNLEAKENIEEFLPDAGVDVHILVTSRGEQPGFVSVKLELLSPEQSEILLVQESGRMPQSTAEEEALLHIVGILDGLPLALELAGAYMARRDAITWPQYAAMLDNDLHDSFARAEKVHDGGFTKHETGLFATLRLSESLTKDNPLLQEILPVLAWSGTAAMGIDLLRTILGEKSEHHLRDALSLGVNLRLLKPEEGDRYSLHRLIRHVQQGDNRLADDQAWTLKHVARLGDWFEEHRRDVMELPLFEAEIDHLETWLEQIGAQDLPQKARLLWLQAYPPFHRGQYELSKNWLETALNSLVGTSNESNKLRAHILNDLGTILGQLGNYDGGGTHSKDALEIRKKLLGENHPDTAFSMSNVCASYLKSAKIEDALRIGMKALSIQENLPIVRRTDMALSLALIGHCYYLRDQLDLALEYELRALDIRKEFLGDQHPHTAFSLDCLGTIFSELGNHEKALELREESLRVRQNALGDAHPDTALSLNNVGVSRCHSNEHDLAIHLQLQSINILQDVVGELHPNIATAWDNIGMSYLGKNDLDKALKANEKALHIRERTLGTNHQDTAKSLYKIGLSHLSGKRFSKAARHLGDASRIHSSILGHQHRYSLLFTQKYVEALVKLGEGKTKGLPLIRRALRGLPRDNPKYENLKRLKEHIEKAR